MPDPKLVAEAAGEALSELASDGGPTVVLAFVEAAILSADGVELPEGVAESLTALRAALEPSEGEAETPDTPAEAAAEGERLLPEEAVVARKDSGMYSRADAGTVQDDGTVILCTDGEARDGHILDIATLRTDNYKRNPVLYYNHASWSADALPIGRIVPESIAEVTVGKGRGLSGRPEFHRATEQGIEVATLWDKGYLRCVSATWRASSKAEDTIARRQLPVDHPAYKADSYGYFFKNAELVEESVVGIPSDTAAERVRQDGPSVKLPISLDDLTETLLRSAADRFGLKPVDPPANGDWWE